MTKEEAAAKKAILEANVGTEVTVVFRADRALIQMNSVVVTGTIEDDDSVSTEVFMLRDRSGVIYFTPWDVAYVSTAGAAAPQKRGNIIQ